MSFPRAPAEALLDLGQVYPLSRLQKIENGDTVFAKRLGPLKAVHHYGVVGYSLCVAPSAVSIPGSTLMLSRFVRTSTGAS
jgi:hypothetical protein